MYYLFAYLLLSPCPHMCLCVSTWLPPWRLGCVPLQKWLVKRSRAWGLLENLGSLSLLQPSTSIPSLLHTEMMPNFLSCKNPMAFSVWKTTISHNGEGIHFRRQETDPKSTETVTLLEIWPIRYSFSKWLSSKISLSLGNTHLLIPLGQWV